MNSFGKIFRISIFGESHGFCVGVTIDGVPAGIPILEQDFEIDLKRRNPENIFMTMRKEEDKIEIISGIFNSKTTGAPLTIIVKNKNFDSKPYEILHDIPRPSHSDFVAKIKYKGYNDIRGSGIFSGRMTAALVIAAVIAKKILSKIDKKIKIESKVISIAGIKYPSKQAIKILEEAEKEGDTLSGVVETRIKNCPVGVGEPFFDSLESYISHIVFSIPGVKAISFGNILEKQNLKGSEFIDKYINNKGKTITNNSGGINGGISNGNEIYFKTYFRPASSMKKEIETINFSKKEKIKLTYNFKYDTCYALRTPVILESCTGVALLDLILLHSVNGNIN